VKRPYDPNDPFCYHKPNDEFDPMHLGNSKVPRTFIEEQVLCAVMRDGNVLHFETQTKFHAGRYADQAFKKFGRCRVLFFRNDEYQCWKEIRWKNANVGTQYARPNFKTVLQEEVPPELQVAVMCL
jgi:hypothetical protein